MHTYKAPKSTSESQSH